MLNGVRRWLESSGRAFELRVAREFRSWGARVQQSYVFADPVTNVQREGDVLARFEWEGPLAIPSDIRIVVECKGSQQYPWLGFRSQSRLRADTIRNWVFDARATPDSILGALGNIWIGQVPFADPAVASHVVAAHTKDKVNPANDAVRQVLSAAQAHRNWYVANKTGQHCTAILPVVAIEAPLVSCRLDDDGNVDLLEVDHMMVWGHAEGETAKPVHVVRESYLPTFAAGLRDLAVSATEYFQDLR